MTSKIILDSSILVEYVKQNKTDLLEALVETDQFELCINSTVLSETTFHWLALYGSKAPRTLQQNRQIPMILNGRSPIDLLNQFTVLTSDNRIVSLYLELMQQYNLLPNDALIVATAKLHQISAIASYDRNDGPILRPPAPVKPFA